MNIIQLAQTTPEFLALFRRDEPGSPRFTACVGGLMKARFFADDAAQPTWGVLYEGNYGTLYLGGSVTTPVLDSLIVRLKPELGEVLLGMWEDDPRLEIVPKARDYDGYAVDFWDRPVGEGLEPYLNAHLAGCQVEPFELSHFYEPTAAALPPALDLFTVGYAVYCGERRVSTADAAHMGDKVMEMGTATDDDQRRKGYATVTCAHVIKACEDKGYTTYWNTNEQNLPSLALARKLGYRQERRYRLFAWT